MKKKGNAARFNSMYNFLHDTDIAMGDFWQRLKVQKTAYLLRLLGFQFSEAQSWYVRGPYSSSLATLAYKIDEMEQKPLINLDPIEIKRLTALKTHFGEELVDYDKIELLVSVLYAMNEKKSDQSSIVEWVRKNKPWYKETKIKKMLEKVIKNVKVFEYGLK